MTLGLIPRVLISLVHILSETLGTETAREWQLGNTDGNLQSIDQLRKFLERPARALEASDRFTYESRESNRDKRTQRLHAKAISLILLAVSSATNHIAFTHVVFLAFTLSITDRHERVKQLKLCFNCLLQGHGIETCTSKTLCQTCNRKHITLLHRKHTEAVSTHFTESDDAAEQQLQFSGHEQAKTSYATLLPSAKVSFLNSEYNPV